jgi:type IV secretion system protein VirB9
VYRLRGWVGYQIDLEFEPGEAFVGLAAGDIEALSFVAQDNHLFLKPKAAAVGTNLTVLTTRRHYHFDYTAQVRRSTAAGAPDAIFALRFQYPPIDTSGGASCGGRAGGGRTRARIRRPNAQHRLLVLRPRGVAPGRRVR